MGRIIAIDYGTKRVGMAVTDPLRLIATPLKTVPTPEVLHFLKAYLAQEEVATFVVGMPKHLNNTASVMTGQVNQFMQVLHKEFPDKEILQQDERYTSRLALASMVEGGFKKKDRRNKSHVDKLSATLILLSFLNTLSLNSLPLFFYDLS